MSNDRSFWPAFQKRWAALLCERTQGLDLWSEAMARALATGIIEVPNSTEAHAALDALNLGLQRLESAADALQQTAPDEESRAHFVRYGAALLSAPPGALASATDGPTLASLDDGSELDYGALRRSLHNLCEWLHVLQLNKPRRVCAPSDFDSQIIGRALARQLEIECQVTDGVGDGFTRSKSLLVCADSRDLTASPLRTIFPGQVIYSLNLHREAATFAPDVAGFAHSGLSLPWQKERLTSRRVDSIVERIADAPMRRLSTDWPNRLEFYRARRVLLTAGNPSYSRLLMLPGNPY